MATTTDLTFLSTVELTDLMQRRELSPVELLEHCYRRVEELDGRLNAFVLLRRDEALADARESERRFRSGDARPLEGLLVPVKDNVALQGAPTTDGSRMGPPAPAPADAELVARLRRAGALFPGKTNLPEFGTIPTTEGERHGAAHNPWDLDRTPGGSSGGAAIAVATGMTPIAHGNDGGGSLRIPAACCGVFGFKPSRGRVPHGPFVTENLAGLTIDGFISRTVRDNARFLDVISGGVAGDPFPAPPPARPFERETLVEPTRLRVAWTVDPPLAVPVHPAHAAAVRDAADLCATLGHEVEEAAPDWLDDDLLPNFTQLWAASIGTGVDLLTEAGGDPAAIEPHNRAMHELGRSITGNDLGVAMARLRRYAWRVAALWDRFDILLTPTLAEPPPLLGSHFELSADEPMYPIHRAALWMLHTPAFNVTGQPAASLPLAWHEGLPVGVQAVGRLHGEATLYQLSAQLEAARPWADRRPPVS